MWRCNGEAYEMERPLEVTSCAFSLLFILSVIILSILLLIAHVGMIKEQMLL